MWRWGISHLLISILASLFKEKAEGCGVAEDCGSGLRFAILRFKETALLNFSRVTHQPQFGLVQVLIASGLCIVSSSDD